MLPFYFLTQFEENGSSGYCDVYPRRLNISGPLTSHPQDGALCMFEKRPEMHSRNAIGCCSSIPDLKKDILYNLLGMFCQWYSKEVYDGLILSNWKK